MSSSKGKTRQSFADPFELGREVVRSVKQGTVKEAQESAKTFLSQLLGLDLGGSQSHASAQEAQHDESAKQQNKGVIFDVAKHNASASEHTKSHKEVARPKEAAIDYHRDIVKNRERMSKHETQEMQRNIEQIKVELSRLVASSQMLKMEFSDITVQQAIPNIGQYHVNFFEWILTVIRSARQKVEDSNSWMGAVKGKGAKRDYWGMFKQHGTTFGLSGERAVATQVG